MVKMENKSNTNAIILKDAKTVAKKSKAAILSNVCDQIDIARKRNKNKTSHGFVSKLVQVGKLVCP